MPRPAPYTVSLYRRGSAGASAYREQGAPWGGQAVGVECDIQPAGGEGLESTPYGQDAGISHHGFFDTGLDLRMGDGVVVTAGPGMVGQRFTVEVAHDWGAPGDLEVELRQTRETFE